MQNHATIRECIEAIDHQDPVVRHTAIRVVATRGANDCFMALDQEHDQTSILRALAMIHRPDVVQGLAQGDTVFWQLPLRVIRRTLPLALR